MSAQDIMLGAQVVHLRELKTEIAKLKAENVALRDELGALKAHFDQALLASADLRDLPEGGTFEIWDGWNLVLGAKKEAKDRDDLFAQAKAHLAAHPTDRIWIVLDGHDESVKNEGRLRISYTGGTGEHRADRFIIDFVRMAAYLGLANRVRVRTNDKDFLRQVSIRTGRALTTGVAQPRTGRALTTGVAQPRTAAVSAAAPENQ